MRTISIILPFFKYKHYFKECLQNLAQSTFKDFELIVVKFILQEINKAKAIDNGLQ